MARVLRKQKPPVLSNYRRYKPYLRIDFEHRCAYCHIPELKYGPTGNYCVDHFRPKSRPEFKSLICRYSNLFYVCQDCNRHKGKTWPLPRMRVLGFRFLDPCQDDFVEHWTVESSGAIVPKTRAAEYMIARVALNREYLVDWRHKKTGLLARIGRLEQSLTTAPSLSLIRQEVEDVIAELTERVAGEFGDAW